MDTHSCYLQLEKILTAELEHTRTLQAALQEEKEFIRGEPERLSSIAARKEQVIKTLESLHREQQALLQHHDFSATREGVEACLQWCDSRQQLSPVWQQLLTTLQQCQQENSINRVIIDGAQRSTRHALTLLYGQSPEKPSYGASGEKIEHALSRTIGKA